MRGVSSLVLADLFLLLSVFYMAHSAQAIVEVPSHIRTEVIKEGTCGTQNIMKLEDAVQLKRLDASVVVCVELPKQFIENFNSFKFIPKGR